MVTTNGGGLGDAPKLARAAVIVVLGFFALVAQTLLFREFLIAFEGNELGVGSFFGSWLLWVALGAAAGRSQSRPMVALTARFELLTLLYIPTFLLQDYGIEHARELGGVTAYEVYPFARMFAVSLLANAPISFLTGFLFTLACRWSSVEYALPVARVYILETFGGFAGGIVVTLLLAAGVTPETVFLSTTLLLTLSAGVSRVVRSDLSWSPGLWGVIVILLVTVPALMLSGFAGRWTRYNNRTAWHRLLPPEDYQGYFTTAQAKYLYGQREGQFLAMSWGGVSEALPNTEHASEVVALSLAQHPAARRVLVVGPGSLSICTRLTMLPQIRGGRVVWLHPDPDYPKALFEVLPERFKRGARHVEVPGTDVRRFIRESPHRFDLVLLNLPDATTLVLNRYWTREFFELVKGALADGGVVSTRISGGANYLGGELAFLGSSALQTLESVFQHVVLKPGDESWLITSDTGVLSTAPALLRDRFARIEGAAGVYPPDGLFSLYVPDRAEFQLEKYRQAAAATGGPILLNTDRRPKALLLSMLLALRRAEFLSLSRHLPVILLGSVWIAACPILLYGVLRLVYLAGPLRQRNAQASAASPAVFDGHFLIFSTGLAGMSLSIVLMFLYQSQFGSLFLHIGLISSLFMLGSCLGSLLSERLLVRLASEPRYLPAAFVLAHLILVGLIFLLSEDASPAQFAILFAGCGVFVGIYFPVAAHRLRAAGRSPAAAGSNLEMLDHVGGAVGAVLTGWFLLPVLGGELALCVLSLLVVVNLVPTFVRARPARLPAGADRFDRLVRPAGYTMLGVAAFVLIASHIVAAVQTGQPGQRLLAAAKAMTGGAEFVEQRSTMDDGTALTYFDIAESDEGRGGFVFGSVPLVKGVSGYGGPIDLAVYVDRDGTLHDLRVIRSHETPAYLESLEGWLTDLQGRNVFKTAPFEDVDAVSGATMTSEAVLRTLAQSGRGFATTALGLDVQGPPVTRDTWIPDREFVCLAILMAAAVALRRRPEVWTRRAFLLGSLLLTGVFLNLQYSAQQVMALLSFQLPGTWLSGSFFLIVLVPVLVLFFGNVYCGYVCPFGALQELIGDLQPKRLAAAPDDRVWRYGRAVKYVLLLLLVVLFALTRNYGVLSADPLITVFSVLRDRAVLTMAIAILVTSVFFRRFWCRNLCPAGAFLAFLCGVRLLKTLNPPGSPARCDLGVRAASELDCLCCDRCKHEKS